jgi:hypothetical protein
MHRDANVLRDWLQDQHIKPSRVRTAEDRNQKAVSKEMRDMGVEPPGRTRQSMEGLTRIFQRWLMSREIRAFYVYLLGIHVMDGPALATQT